MNTNILREEKYKVNLSQNIELEKIIDFDKIIKHDFSKKLVINGFYVEKKENFYFINKGRFFDNNNIFNTYNLIKNYNDIFFKYKDLFSKLLEDKTIITSSINSLISYLYYEVIAFIEIAIYKHKYDLDNSIEKEKINQLLGKKLEYSKKQNKIKTKEYVKTKLTQRTVTAKYWNLSGYSNRLDSSIIKIANNLKLRELELPRLYEKNKVINLLSDFEYVLDTLNIKNRKFELRFKKIGLYRKRGMYLKNAECLIVDPRYSETLFHELGHFIHETNTIFFINNKKITKASRKKIIKDNEYKYQNQLKNHKVEELDSDSEIFAYWFEDMIKNDILNNKTN